MTYAVELTNVSKVFADSTAVDDVSLQIRDGEFFSLLGPSGCGKTTTLRMIAGFETPTSGDITIHGQVMGDMPPYKRPVNTVFQSYALFPHLTVAQNVAFGLQMRSVKRAEISQRDLMGAALMYLGYSYNETDPAKVAKARDAILGVKQYIHAINATDYQETLLIPHEVAISQAWSGDALKAALATEKDANKGTWKFIIPKEGSSRSNDGACVLASSKHKATAEHFINFITEAKNAARVSNFTKYYSPNKAARQFIDPAINNFMPDAKTLDKLQVGKPLDEKTTKLYDDTWTEIRAGQ